MKNNSVSGSCRLEGVTGGFSERQKWGPILFNVISNAGTTIGNMPRECVGNNELGSILLIEEELDDLQHWNGVN